MTTTRRPTPVSLLLALIVVVGLADGACADPRPGSRRHFRGDHGADWRDDDSFPVVQTARRSESFRLGARGRLVVDSFAGAIRARAVDGDTLRLTVEETVRAEDEASLERARLEMPLRLGQEGDTVTAYVDAPFRAPDGSFQGPSWELPYRVVYDFTLEVPRSASVTLKTVLDGDVELAGIDGDFEVKNVNGDVTVSDVAGAGIARTVNGPLRVSFRRNPPGDCDFGTVNGDVTVDFQPGLGAEVRYRTMNGEAWSDFPFSVVPIQPQRTGERRDGRWTVRSRWSDGIRIGAGGPKLSFETINGDILLRERS